VRSTATNSGVAPIAATVGSARYSLSATTTVYLVAQGNFSGGTLAGYGVLWARRRR
jgi:hypothetical protein